VCSHGFVVRADEDVEALDPFASDKVDNPLQPSFGQPLPLDADATAHEVVPPTFELDLEPSPHDTKTAVHMVAPANRGRAPATFDDVETLVDPPMRAAMTLDDVSAAVAPGMPSHAGPSFPNTSPGGAAYDFLNIDISDDSATALTDDDVMSIDDDDLGGRLRFQAGRHCRRGAHLRPDPRAHRRRELHVLQRRQR
jgi:hypothetical protein